MAAIAFTVEIDAYVGDVRGRESIEDRALVLFGELALGFAASLVVALSSAQTGPGTITGFVTDPSGAVVANAPVEVKNTGTGVAYRTTTTDTGNYSVQQLPIGNYDVTVTVQGFKGFNRKGLTLSAVQVMRIDIPLQLGSSAESVTVTGEATLLKTENGALVHNVTINQLDNIPILTTNGNFRDPFALLLLIPGSNYVSSSFSVNGAPTNTQNILIEGQTAVGWMEWSTRLADIVLPLFLATGCAFQPTIFRGERHGFSHSFLLENGHNYLAGLAASKRTD